MAQTHPAHIAFGIDVGGSGIKGACVDTKRGVFYDERTRIPTPENSTPAAVAEIVRQIVEEHSVPTHMPVGVALPAPVIAGVVPSMANLSPEWAGVNAEELFSQALGRPVTVINDADAAGLAEVIFGFGKTQGVRGTVLCVTLGTGIGSALIVDGHLVPNTELGHLNVGESPDVEQWASAAARTRDGLSMPDWAGRLQVYFNHVERLINPDAIIVGGGVSKKSDQFLPFISTRALLVPAQLLNTAGIVGVALAASRDERQKAKVAKKAAKSKTAKKAKKAKKSKKAKAKK